MTNALETLSSLPHSPCNSTADMTIIFDMKDIQKTKSTGTFDMLKYMSNLKKKNRPEQNKNPAKHAWKRTHRLSGMASRFPPPSCLLTARHGQYKSVITSCTIYNAFLSCQNNELFSACFI